MIIGTASDAAKLLIPMFSGCAEEKLVTAHLDSDQRLIATITARDGGRDEVELPIRSIIEDPLRLGLAGIIVAHNHPSGILAARARLTLRRLAGQRPPPTASAFACTTI